ncbi:MFS transporter [soil metagenome]
MAEIRAREQSNGQNSWRHKTKEFLGLERNVVIVSAVVFLLGAGEELWKKFLPKYLETLGASAGIIGFFGTAKDFLDAIYQYPGGWLADRVGRRRAFLTFIALASIGYLIYLFSSSWIFVFVGLAFTMAWSSMASPAIFATIGDALPDTRRTMGFTLQSMLKRVPMSLAPLLGGALIASAGIVGGIRIALIITLGIAIATVLIVSFINLPVIVGEPENIRGVWSSFHFALKRLLVSDILIRTCESLTEIFIILYVTNITGISIVQYGVLVAIQMAASILVYIPAAWIADRIGRKPFVVATFVCFALFPVAVIVAANFTQLVFAFIIGGLREIGEPSRKTMIVNFAAPHARARTVGLYYLMRSLTITPAAAIGGLLWKFSPETPFIAAGIIGVIGTLVFIVTVDERYAS